MQQFFIRIHKHLYVFHHNLLLLLVHFDAANAPDLHAQLQCFPCHFHLPCLHSRMCNLSFVGRFRRWRGIPQDAVDDVGPIVYSKHQLLGRVVDAHDASHDLHLLGGPPTLRKRKHCESRNFHVSFQHIRASRMHFANAPLSLSLGTNACTCDPNARTAACRYGSQPNSAMPFTWTSARRRRFRHVPSSFRVPIARQREARRLVRTCTSRRSQVDEEADAKTFVGTGDRCAPRRMAQWTYGRVAFHSILKF
mmetsp:Transcript_10727/g.66138  ORF Transcript_10727/g.66138 Transcript_10727/m.66138 type:complete len:251 (+) Transcript_10727:1332-2084(+)